MIHSQGCCAFTPCRLDFMLHMQLKIPFVFEHAWVHDCDGFKCGVARCSEIVRIGVRMRRSESRGNLELRCLKPISKAKFLKIDWRISF